MKLTRLRINGFRNLKKTELTFDPDHNLVAFVGQNGQGKTNLLESIFLLAVSKSFRAREQVELIGHDREFCRLEASISAERAEELCFVLARQPQKKTLKLNGSARRAADYVGHLNVVFFSPDDMGLISLSPNVRRRYLDLFISQFSRDYLEACLQYQSALKQRNSLLKQINENRASEDELDAWDSALATYGRKLTGIRSETIQSLNGSLAAFYKRFDGEGELALKYLPSPPSADSRERFIEYLTSHRVRDLRSGSTELGPHRDDFRFLIGGADMASFGSRGEWRSAILALKFAEINHLTAKTGHKPVLLLDDVFSELDDARQKHLFTLFEDGQVFISTTHESFLDGIQSKRHVYHVQGGEISKRV